MSMSALMNNRIFKNFFYGVMIITLTALCGPSAHAFSEMIVFGDSLSDSGNVYIATNKRIPASPYYDGRFTNGPNYADDIASHFLLSLEPFLEGGSSYAVAGAKTAGFPDGLPYDFLSQVSIFRNEIFLGIADKPDKDALYVVFIGSNDMLAVINDAIADPENQSTIIQEGVSQIVGNIRDGLNDLIDEDAVNILVPNLPNLGRIPRLVSSSDSSSLATSATMTFNEALDVMLDMFGAINIIRFDTFSLLEEAVNNPSAFGLSNVVSACYTGDDDYSGDGTVCADPESYLFWDQIHPTAKAHQILANHMLATLIDNAWLEAGASDLGGGWRWIDWFGYFYVSQAPWIYHEDHRWLYQFGSSTDNLIFWDAEMDDFWWTREGVYPYLYRFSDGTWLWYQQGSYGPRWFYNFQSSQWESY